MTRERAAANAIGSRLTEPAGAPVVEGTLADIAWAGVNPDVPAAHGPIDR